MTVRELVLEMDTTAVTGTLDVPVHALAYDSRRVAKGDVFFALAGQKQDGARFVRDAVAAGAVAVVASPGVDVAGAARIEAPEPRLALAQAANAFHAHPSRAMKVVAVTGTNGKTTTTWMLESIFRAAGWSAGVMGTTGVRFAGMARPSAFTTPEAPELQALLAEMRDAGVRGVAMEVSSHALAQYRSWGVEPDVAIFTNLTQDHLDFHGTMDAYLDAKLMLFDGRNGAATKSAMAVVNTDDPHADAVIAAARRGGLRVVTVTIDPARTAADFRVRRLEATASGLRLEIAGSAGGSTLVLPMLGRYNAANALGAWAAAQGLGFDAATVARGLEALPAVPGRLERVEAGQSFLVVVDYAHTPDALERALDAVREHTSGRLVVAFGCGGDRDRGKRPLMGGVAARLADAVWVTSDNPRSEDPAAIVAEIVAGARGARDLHTEVDRRAAIAAALAAARPGDAVLIAGKGHETTQTIGDRVLPFDDRQVARELLKAPA